MTVLLERELEGYHATVTLEHDPILGLQVSVLDSVGVIEWAKHPENGKEALDLFHHPFAYGFREDEQRW